MTIAATITAPVSYSCNGVATEFSFPYRFLSDDDLTVYLVENATGTSTTLTLTTHYTVTGAGGPSGGTVTTVATYASGYTLVVVLEPDFTQETDLVDNDPMPAATLENALDKLTMMAQLLLLRLNRAFRLGDDDTSGASTTLPTPAATKLIGWNAAGDALENYAAADFSTATVTAYAETLLDDTDAATARATLELGDSATKDTGTAAGTVAAGDHNHDTDYADIAAEAQVSISGNDTTVGFLNGKLVAGTGITLTEDNDAGDETLTVSFSGGGTLTAGTALVQNPYSTSATVTQAHGLGAHPTQVDAYLECITAELNYSVGDRVRFSGSTVVGNGTSVIGLTSDATNLYLTTGSAAPYIPNKTTGAETQISASKWKYVATPYLLG